MICHIRRKSTKTNTLKEELREMAAPNALPHESKRDRMPRVMAKDCELQQPLLFFLGTENPVIQGRSKNLILKFFR
jgi:hypothetical protein